MASDPVKRHWTVEEYLAYEEETGVKHEYLDGDIYAMSGGTPKHSRIASNTMIAIGRRLDDSDCHTHNSDLKIKVGESKYVYPEMSIVCGEDITAPEGNDILTNPIMVVEVISPSSASYERLQKSEYYRSLPSLQIYLILEQDKPFAQLWSRREDGWLLQDFSGVDATLPLTAIDCTLPLSEVYRGVEF